jgi:L-serine dehydratase
MAISVLQLFTIGIGPSSSHTVGPMRAAGKFVEHLAESGVSGHAESVTAHLYGSLAMTGRGHGTDRAIMLGLEGETPEGVNVESIAGNLERIHASGRLRLGGRRAVNFLPARNLVFHRGESLPAHPNGMRFVACDATGREIANQVFYSMGGGFVVRGEDCGEARLPCDDHPLPFPFTSGADMLRMATGSGLGVSEMALCNEASWRPESETRSALLKVWHAMRDCVERGCHAAGTLPGGLNVPRRAPRLFQELGTHPEASLRDPLTVLDWVSMWAMAVNEENAAGGRVVTAPTNGAAGIIPAVLHYLVRIHGADDDRVVRFLLTAGTIGLLYKRNASISGAEVGCQGEVGVACSMAAGALAEALGGTVAQIENAAEIGMEHNLGLTCDPVGGLVQVPCIERNAMGAVKAIHAARLALAGDGTHKISLDKVIATMRQTGADMSSKYKETSRGGLALSLPEC